ncbi:MAG: tRNA uridine-5-carboxymethylaminomethyl(34) synthesis enzyme MnmG [Dysgonamonadaceae bacterium]|nr:tRNA uridine-5-carboxymethylaminomethyl(34) synthesis enzyme MnmG [Dysgonamonadaceae bacterium]MDD4727176.1 tRNA uridine-5-carboxymethylaminomethyl(34) synthesis enzyme MnmG [Dysgonamonadaceae bacterium]
MNFNYDIIVVGAGHAGCEAAATAANMGSKTLLVTMDMNRIAQMSCNPAVGGIAKGQIVREIDAMGGQMGIVSDETAIQFRMLNRSKGPAMWSPRTQNDREKFISNWRNIIENTPNLFLWQDKVTQLILKDGEVQGVKTQLGVEFFAKSVILTNGTFLNGVIHVGAVQFGGGRLAEPSSYGITEQLFEAGFKTDRMKTGTPARVDGRSVDFSLTQEQAGDDTFHKFSYLNTNRKQLKQRSCWLTHTNEDVHDSLREGLKVSPLYNGQIKSIGPRYCVSIESKIITFADKTSHQIFLEPEGENTHEYYLNGFSSSLPLANQIEAMQRVPALRNVHIFRPGYAIEYDFFDPSQLEATLETKLIKNLYFAGQINGTTGYEEAAGQGMIAAINAHIKCHGGNPFVLRRDEAYIGVLIDDLITKGVDEPYRMFTSRAEYRILLRQDNADERLTLRAADIGLAKNERVDLLNEKAREVNRIIDFSKKFSLKPDKINSFLESIGTSPLKQGVKLIDLLTRPEITLEIIQDAIPALKEELDKIQNRTEEIVESANITVKYEGYIKRERLIADKITRLENIAIKDKFDYNTIQSLSTEARQKLTSINPQTIAQASRIPGVSPNDISVLLVLLGR